MTEVNMGKKPENMTEVVVNMVGATVVSWGTYFWMKRAIRKRGGPKWAQYGFARLLMIANSPNIKKQFHLEPEEITPVVLKWLEENPNHKLAKYLVVKGDNGS